MEQNWLQRNLSFKCSLYAYNVLRILFPSDSVLTAQPLPTYFGADRGLRWTGHPAHRILPPRTGSPHWQIHNRQVRLYTCMLSSSICIAFHDLCQFNPHIAFDLCKSSSTQNLTASCTATNSHCSLLCQVSLRVQDRFCSASSSPLWNRFLTRWETSRSKGRKLSGRCELLKYFFQCF